jgi:hypothetical protein
MGTNRTSSPQSTVLAPTVRIFAGVVLLVLFGGIALLVYPELIVTRWPWRLAPYAARFLGAIYTAEFVALVVLVIVNRWAPGRLTLVMALVFTLTVTLVSAFHLEQFDFSRRGPWGWFLLYGGSALASAALLWQHRSLAPPGPPRMGGWRLVFLIQAVLLGGYGALMLISPETATALWPWPADAFTGRVYSGMFLAAGVGAFMLSTRSSPANDLAFGLTQVTLGIASLASFFLATPPPAPYVKPNPTSWILGCTLVVAFGLVALAAAGRARLARPVVRVPV